MMVEQLSVNKAPLVGTLYDAGGSNMTVVSKKFAEENNLQILEENVRIEISLHQLRHWPKHMKTLNNMCLSKSKLSASYVMYTTNSVANQSRCSKLVYRRNSNITYITNICAE